MWLIVVAVMLLAVAGSAFGAPRMEDSDQKLLERIVAWDQEVKGGDHYMSKDSSDLGWGESGMLATFYHMYCVTGDTLWLDRIAQHADVIFANATRDSRGHLGWFTPVFSKGFAQVSVGKDNKGDAKPSSAELEVNGMEIAPKVTGHTYTLTVQPDGQLLLHDDTIDAKVAAFARGETAIKVSMFEVRLQGTPRPGDSFTIKTTAPESVDYIVHEGMLFWPISRFVEIVLADRQLDSRYGARARRYLQMMDEAIIPCWEDRWRDFEGGGGAYLATNVPTHRFPDITLPHNQYLAMGRAFLVLYRVTGKKVYLDRATKMARFFRSALRRSTDGYVWNYWDPGRAEDASGKAMQHGEDSSHASIDVQFATEAYEAGIVFTKQDLSLMASTFAKQVWNQSTDAPSYGSTLERSADPQGKNDGRYVYGWQMLGRYCPDVIEAIRPLYANAGKWFSPSTASEWLYAQYAKPVPAQVRKRD